METNTAFALLAILVSMVLLSVPFFMIADSIHKLMIRILNQVMLLHPNLSVTPVIKSVVPGNTENNIIENKEELIDKEVLKKLEVMRRQYTEESNG